MASEPRIIKSRAQEDLESVVKQSASKTPVAVVLQSSAWHNKANHNRHCSTPELVAVQNVVEEQERVKSLIGEQTAPKLQTLAEEKVVEKEQVEVDEALAQHKAESHQTASTFGKGGKDSYMPAETFQAGCTCGADITVGGHDAMHQGDLVTGGSEYSTNMSGDDAKDTSYLTNTSGQGNDPQDNMTSGSMMGYDGQQKKQGSEYMP